MTINQLKVLYPYCAIPFWYDMHSRDTTVLTVVHYSSLFQYFFRSIMVSTLVENS